MKNIFLSIIIPVFNSQNTVARCIESVIKEKRNDIEVIVVNDGSTDNTLNVCQKMAMNNEMVKVINKENGGVSSARNVGIENAKGMWITFLDSDDMFLGGVLNNIDFCSDASLMIYGYQRQYGSMSGTGEMEIISSGEIQKMILNYTKYNNVMKKVRPIDGFSNFTCWARFFRRDIIVKNNVRFPIGITHGEDLVFCYDYLKYVYKVCLIDSTIYFYNENVDSVTHNFNPQQIFNTEKLFDVLMDKDSSLCHNKDFYSFIADRITTRCIDFWGSEENRDSLRKKVDQLKIFCHKTICLEAIKKCDMWHLSEGKYRKIEKGLIVLGLRLKCYSLLIVLSEFLSRKLFAWKKRNKHLCGGIL